MDRFLTFGRYISHVFFKSEISVIYFPVLPHSKTPVHIAPHSRPKHPRWIDCRVQQPSSDFEPRIVPCSHFSRGGTRFNIAPSQGAACEI